MKTVIAAAGMFWALTLPAGAAGLCNCCGDLTSSACSAACNQVRPAAGQCIATVDYAAGPGVNEGTNPLYDMDLRDVRLGSPSAAQLEAFRRMLEAARRGAEADRKAAVRARRRGKIDTAEAASRAKRYDKAIVNYYLGIQAYRLTGHADN